ncbi:MAG: cell division protein FtsH, partial [Planctomycetota bacterium]
LGGRPAELLLLEDISAGAQNDLEIATEAARQMVEELGMSEVGIRTTAIHGFNGSREEMKYGAEFRGRLDREIERILKEQNERAKQLLTENLEKLKKLISILLESKELKKEQIFELLPLENPKKPENKPPPIKS